MKKHRIGLGSDHAGFIYKSKIKEDLEKEGYVVTDFGTHSTDSVDYPDFVHPLARAVQEDQVDTGILFCGSANGVAITANKHQGIRAAIAWNEEVAKLARQHNDANVLCLPARFISEELAYTCTRIFLNTEFEAGRHAERVKKIAL